MHARYFSAHLGRFMVPDPIGAVPGWPQSWNRYAYVQDNPVTYVDPQGLWPFFPLGDIPIATFSDQITTTSTGIPLPFLNFLGFGNFLRNLGFLNGPSVGGPSPVPPDFLTLHQRTDVQLFFACLGKKSNWGAPLGQEAGGFGRLDDTGNLRFFYTLGATREVEIGRPPADAVLVAHSHPSDAITGFLPHGHDVIYANTNTGIGGQRIPNYIIHARAGVTRYLLGTDTPPGTVVLGPDFARGLTDVCAGVSPY